MLHPETASYSDFPAGFDRVRGPVFVRRGRKTKAVVLSAKQYEQLSEAQERLEVLQAIDEGQRQAVQGLGMSTTELRKRLKQDLGRKPRSRARSKP